MADAREVIAVIAAALREAQELRLGYTGTSRHVHAALAEAGLAVVPRADLEAAELRTRDAGDTDLALVKRDMRHANARLRAALAAAEGSRDG